MAMRPCDEGELQRMTTVIHVPGVSDAFHVSLVAHLAWRLLMVDRPACSDLSRTARRIFRNARSSADRSPGYSPDEDADGVARTVRQWGRSLASIASSGEV